MVFPTYQSWWEGERLGQVFENLVIAETTKRHLNQGKSPDLYFYRDDSKVEVDLLDCTNAAHPLMAEVKASETYHDKYARHLARVGEELGIPEESRAVVLRVREDYRQRGVNVVSADTWLERGMPGT